MNGPIDGKTRILGVLGESIDYTASPAIQNAALDHFKMNYLYLAFSIESKRLGAWIETVRDMNMPGLNVTIPHKETIVKLLDEVSPLAEKLGAVNTVVHREGILRGENTDCFGFEQLLQSLSIRSPRSALVIGAGGASRAAIHTLSQREEMSIRLTCRKPTRGKRLVSALGVEQSVEVVPWDKRAGIEADLLVNATPLGQKARDPLPVPPQVVRHAKWIADLVVRPQGTKLVSLGRSYGAEARDGSTMLVEQGRESFQLWFGKRPPAAVMEEALKRVARDGR